jgi:hypothetical protein
MFIDNVVRKKFEDGEKYDKFAIASTILGVSFEGAECSLLESQVLSSCQSCNLRYICGQINGVIEDYIERTTVVTGSFNFGK